MSTSVEVTADLLSDLYVERESNQWKTVDNCLTDLCAEKVISYPELVSVALGLEERGSPSYQQLIRRASRLNDRKGNPGQLEVQRLAQAALQVAVFHSEDRILAAHLARIGFGIADDDGLASLVEAAKRLTLHAINEPTRRRPKYSEFPEAPEIGDVVGAIKERDEYLEVELWRRDQIMATQLACLVGQIDPWLAVDELVGPHTRPYPFKFEFTASQACFSSLAKEGVIDVAKLHPPPESLKSADSINCPLLSGFTASHDTDVDGVPVYATTVPLQEFVCQLLLEILIHREGGES